MDVVAPAADLSEQPFDLSFLLQLAKMGRRSAVLYPDMWEIWTGSLIPKDFMSFSTAQRTARFSSMGACVQSGKPAFSRNM